MAYFSKSSYDRCYKKRKPCDKQELKCIKKKTPAKFSQGLTYILLKNVCFFYYQKVNKSKKE